MIVSEPEGHPRRLGVATGVSRVVFGVRVDFEEAVRAIPCETAAR